jgi:hypothetical protein
VLTSGVTTALNPSAPALALVYPSEADAIEAAVGLRLSLAYEAALPRVWASPPTFVARRRNVVVIGPGASEPLVVRTALAHLRCVPYC